MKNIKISKQTLSSLLILSLGACASRGDVANKGKQLRGVASVDGGSPEEFVPPEGAHK